MPPRLLIGAGVLAASLMVVYEFSQPSLVIGPAQLAALFAVIFVLDLLDLRLPHGDRIGVEGPIVAAALVVFSPIAVLMAALVARLVAIALDRQREGPEGLLAQLSTSAAGVAAASAVVASLRPSLTGATEVLDLLAVALSCVSLLGTQVVYSQLLSALRMQRPFRGLLFGNLRMQGPLLVAETSASVLLALTYGQMGVWALVLVVILLLLLRHSYSLLLDVRQTYMNTVEVLVDTAESADSRRTGHSERTAIVARSIAEEIGVSSAEVERLSYAALLHDIDLVGVDPEDMDERREHPARQTGRVLSKVGFLADVVPLLQILDGDTSAAKASAEHDRTLAFIIAVASDIDARSHAVPSLSEEEIRRVATLIGPREKSRVVGAALRLGYSAPAVP